jgi:16S rRNA (cytidine1402-2'-O)-methyltransferase
VGQVTSLPYTLIFLESPHRLLEALQDLQAVFGNRQCAVARELTKLHEEIFRGSLEAAFQHFTAQGVRGEFTLVVAGCPPESEPRWSSEQILAALKRAAKDGIPPSQSAKEIARLSGWSKKDVYKLLTQQDTIEEKTHEPG